jgi:hypothetical protein
MKQVIFSRMAVHSPKQENQLRQPWLKRGRQTLRAGFWLALAMATGGLLFASTVIAQDNPGQDDPKPRRKARLAAQRYPDDQLPSRRVAMNDDLIPPVPANIVSPSNQSSKTKKTETGGEAVPDEASPPARKKTATPQRSVVADEEAMVEPIEPFGNPEGCDDEEFGCRGVNLRGFLAHRLWFRGESLLWWARGGNTPPLLTTSTGSPTLAQAGVLGLSSTQILFGDQELNTGLHAGTRLTFGVMLDRCDETGVEFQYLILGENTQTYSNASMGTPILARPFFNVATGAQDSQIIAFPNSFNGTFNATSTENFQGASAALRRAIVHGNDGRIDFLVGYRYLRLTDGLEIASAVNSSGTSTVSAAGTNIAVTDAFHTRNDFNGADLGFSTQWHRNRWSFDTLLKVGIGQTRSRTAIIGSTTVSANGTSAFYSGGLLALPSNSGTFNAHQFSMVPEIGFTMAYDVTARLKASVGYTMLYWSNVVRPGDQIDLNLDPAQFPPPTATGTKPAFALHTSDYWAQGVNLGLDYRF